LIGDNGSGKTVMLDALAVAAGSFLLGVPDAISRPIIKDEIRAVNLLMGQTGTRETVGETEVFARGVLDGVTLEWKRTLRGASARTTRQFASDLQAAAESLVERAKKGTPTTFPVLGYYGTGRLWKTLNEPKVETNTVLSRYFGYKDCLNPAFGLKGSGAILDAWPVRLDAGRMSRPQRTAEGGLIGQGDESWLIRAR
jgi:predicted ATP-binding protein involved in virulence